MQAIFSQGLRYSGVGLALLALCLLLVQHAQATTWVVDASGKGNFTSLDAIYSNKVKPGDIVYMRGTFTTVQTLQNINGTKDKPITITSYPGTRAIVDGTNASPDNYQGLVRLNLCNFIILDNILIRNSKQSGISFYYNSNAVVQNCEVHDVQIRGIGGCGDNVVIRNNTVYNACMQNYAGAYGSWSQVVSSSSCSGQFLKNWVIEYNRVYNSWGEGIDCIQVSGCIVRHNVVYDTYSVNIYVDNANGVVIDSNYIYSKNPFYYRTTTYTWPATGILVGAESWPANPQPSFDVTIKNNLLVGTNGISNFYTNTNWVNNVRIYYNTIWNPNATGVGPFTWPQQKNVVPSGNEFRNNLIWTKSSWACMSGQRSAWTISNNVWVGVNSIPTNCTDTSATTTSRAVNSTLIKFASGRLPTISSALTDFYLGASSPARGVGVALSSVKTDYNGYARASKPSVGFVEYGTQANSNGGDGDGSSASAATGASFFLAAMRTASALLMMMVV